MLQKSNLQRMAVPAIDVIDYDKSVPNLTLYLREHLDGKIICEDLETAYRLREKRIKGVKTIYTIDGNMLGNDGIISSYGNADSLKKIYKYKNMQDNSSRVNERLQELTK